jgi:hypothetical protein
MWDVRGEKGCDAVAWIEATFFLKITVILNKKFSLTKIAPSSSEI